MQSIDLLCRIHMRESYLEAELDRAATAEPQSSEGVLQGCCCQPCSCCFSNTLRLQSGAESNANNRICPFDQSACQLEACRAPWLYSFLDDLITKPQYCRERVYKTNAETVRTHISCIHRLQLRKSLWTIWTELASAAGWADQQSANIGRNTACAEMESSC